MKKGFTLAEIVIVVSVVSIITAIVGRGLSSALSQQMLNNDVERVVSAIQRARSYTLASRGNQSGTGRRYGVSFDTTTDPDQFVIYDYSTSESSEVETQKLSESTFSSSQKILFTRLTGVVQEPGAGGSFVDIHQNISITLTSKRQPTLKRDIVISLTGVVEIKQSAS